jgi:phenylacetate-CoA ligase
LTAQGYGGKVQERRTSGTTGTAMRFATSADAIAFQWAVWWRHRARFGVQPGAWHLNFTGKLVVPPGQAQPPYWRWNWPMWQALINMQQITPLKIPAIVAFLNRSKFVFYSGYPSILHALTEQIKNQGLSVDAKPSHVFLGAENVQSYQKTGIEEVFGTKVTDQYGLSEGCANASKCEQGNYHEDWEFCHIECLDGVPLPDGGMRGRIVGTGFANDAFPFVRYETGDYGIWADEGYQCPCGRKSRVITSIDGRNEDYVITPEGHRVMRFDYIFKQTDKIMEAQVVQRRLGEIVVKIVPRAGYTKDEEALIVQGIKEFISPTIGVEIELVDGIERSSSGKFRPVLSFLGQEHPKIATQPDKTFMHV